jgi:hypothetical protein
MEDHMPENPLSKARIDRMFILQFAKEALAPAMSANYGPATTVEALLSLADWILAADAEDVPEESENADEAAGFFGRLLADADRKRPTTDDIDALNIDFAKTEQDTPDDFATEVLHPFRVRELKAGFLTGHMRITEIVPDPVRTGNLVIRGLSRHTARAMALSHAPDDVVETVCAACTVQNRAASNA